MTYADEKCCNIHFCNYIVKDLQLDSFQIPVHHNEQLDRGFGSGCTCEKGQFTVHSNKIFYHYQMQTVRVN